MAADAVGLRAMVDIQQAHLVGISMGGALAQLIAIDCPERTLFRADAANPALPVVAKPKAFVDVRPQPQTADHTAYIEWQVKTGQVLTGPVYPTDEATSCGSGQCAILHRAMSRQAIRG